MTGKKQGNYQSGGINIEGSQVQVGGDLVGRDKVTASHNGLREREVAFIKSQFAQIQARLAYHPIAGMDNTQIKTVVERLEQEVLRGDQATPVKVEQWLRFLATMADDIFAVIVATLTHPAAGVAKVIQLVARRVQADVKEGRV